MSWLIAYIDEEQSAPNQQHAARALVRPSLPKPDGISFASAPHGVLGFAQSRKSGRDRLPLPLYVDDERGIYVVADIRLHNRRELRDRLGISRQDISDIALVAEGYLRFGQQLAAKLVGSFALVVWDARSRSLYAARDPMGERPLYHCSRGPRLFVASSIEQLLATFDAIPPLEDETVFGFLGGEFTRISSTFFRGIHRLPPGCFLVASEGGEPKIERYWHPPENFLRLPRTEEYHARFREILDEAVRVRLDSDGPVIAHLSGGLDSSAIACLADRLYRQSPESRPPLRLVSGLYPGLDCDESAFIRAVVEHVSLPWESFDATFLEWPDLERPFLDWPGGRSSQAGSAGDLTIAKREGARVLLSGFGGDDIGSEAGVFRDLASNRQWGALLREIFFTTEFHWGRRERRLVDSLKGLLPHWVHESVLRHRPRRPGPPPTWLGPRMRELWPGPPPWLEPAKGRWLSHMQRWLFRAFTQPNRAWCADIEARQAAEASVEVRYPFFDVRLADFVLSIPPEHRLPSGGYRVIQREAMRGLVPEAILRRYQPTTFEAAFLARARVGLPRFRALFEEGEWLAAPYIEKSALLKLSRALEDVANPERHFAAFRALETAALLEAWLRALRDHRGPAW